MGCGCKKKGVIPAQPGPPVQAPAPPPQPTTAPKAHVILREGTVVRPKLPLPKPIPKPLPQPQKELDRLLDRLRMITARKLA